MVKPLFNWIEISVIDACNRKCSFCPKSNIDEYPNQIKNRISSGLIDKLSDELYDLEYNGTVILAGYGEPLLNKEVNLIINAFHKFDIQLVTNGDLLTTEKLRNMMFMGLKKCIISMYDGEHQIKKFTGMFNTVWMKNYELRERWYDFSTITNRAGTVINSTCLEEECYYPCYSLMIDWNGDVLLCPQDWRKRIKMGNIAFTSLQEIWESSHYDSYRKTLLNGDRKLLNPCKFCNVNGRKKGESMAEEWRKYYAED